MIKKKIRINIRVYIHTHTHTPIYMYQFSVLRLLKSLFVTVELDCYGVL